MAVNDSQSSLSVPPAPSGWLYEQSILTTSSDILKQAQKEAFTEFHTRLGDKHSGNAWLRDEHSMQDVESAVKIARARYENSKNSKARKWLTQLSKRIQIYGNILDFIVQQHPEYVSLVWGAFKFVFTGVVNHEELVESLSKALTRIADALSHVELQAILYPASKMQENVTQLYVGILKFMQRAAGWYSEGKLRHMISSITRPWKLWFDDLVSDIVERARSINQLAVTLAIAEQRQMYLSQQAMREDIRALTQKIVEYQSLNYARALDTNRRVCEIQFSQILSFVSASALASPVVSRQFYAATRNRRRRREQAEYSLHPIGKVNDWSSSAGSSVIVVAGSYRQRDSARDFAADAIDLIEKAALPVIWVLNKISNPSHGFTATDILKQLVHQILQKNHTLLNEKSLSLNAARLQSAVSMDDWLNLLGSSLSGMPQVYIVLDTQILKERPKDGKSWPEIFTSLFDEMRRRDVRTVIKIAFVSYDTSFTRDLDDELSGCVVRIPDASRSSRGLGGRGTRGKARRLFPVVTSSGGSK